MTMGRLAPLFVGAAWIVQAAGAQGAQPVTGPVEIYWMSVSTTSGMGGMMGPAAGGQRPDMAAMMAMGRAPDTNAANHRLVLQLGSSRRPEGGPPTAEHDPPDGLKVGPVLPLLTPEAQAQPARQEPEPGPPPQYRQPRGRMLIFWGCGEQAPPGQPLVIDFAQADPAAAAQKWMALSRGLGVTPMRPPSATRDTTYGEWPNRETRQTVPPDGSLTGDHLVHGDYGPDIRFSLAANQDFLPGIRLTTNEKNPTGSATLAWRPVDGASAYFATLVGARDRDDVVMWTSSATQTAAFAPPDYLSTQDIRRLTADHVLLDAGQTRCVIPREVMAAAGASGLFQLVAYADETNIASPPRPPAPKPWNIAWEVKVRYRSSTSGIVGMDVGRAMGGRPDNGQPNPNRPPPPKKKRPSLFNPLGGLVPPIP